VNYYLSSIQQGIQSAHVLGELAISHGKNIQSAIYSKPILMYFDWLENHKTMIVCNGGNNKDLRELRLLFSTAKYPWAYFREDDDSLDGALTAVGIILPKEIYDVKYDRLNETYIYDNENGKEIIYNKDSEDTDTFKLIHTIKSAPLAR
jgi:hypothetical protein